MNRAIMTVDDSVSVRMMVTYTLKVAGYDVAEAADGEEAWTKLQDGAFGLLIVDINMPNLNGLDLLERIRARGGAHRFVPVVMLTTESQREKRDRAKVAGATAWMVKPFSPESLLEVVGKVLGS